MAGEDENLSQAGQGRPHLGEVEGELRSEGAEVEVGLVVGHQQQPARRGTLEKARMILFRRGSARFLSKSKHPRQLT